MTNPVTFRTAVINQAQAIASQYLEQHATTRTVETHAGQATLFDCPYCDSEPFTVPMPACLLVVSHHDTRTYRVCQILANGGRMCTYQANNAFDAAVRHLIAYAQPIVTASRSAVERQQLVFRPSLATPSIVPDDHPIV